MGHSLLSWLTLQQGRLNEATTHIELALPVMQRIGAHDDTAQLHASQILIALAQHDIDRAQRAFACRESLANTSPLTRTTLVGQMSAEIALANGGTASTLQIADDVTRTIGNEHGTFGASTGRQSWLVVAEASALSARAHYSDDPGLAKTEALARLRDRIE